MNRLVLCIFVSALLLAQMTSFSSAQQCEPITSKGFLESFLGHRMVHGTNDEIFRATMRAMTGEQLDRWVGQFKPCNSNDWIFRSNDIQLTVEYIACPTFQRAMRCNQAAGWPISKNPRASIPSPQKKEMSGEDILSSELNQQRKKGPNDQALNRIDDEEDKLGCNQKPNDPVCRSLEVRRSNLINGDDEMKNVQVPGNTAAAALPVKPAGPDAKCYATDYFGRKCITEGRKTKEVSPNQTAYKWKFQVAASCTGRHAVLATTNEGKELEFGAEGGGEIEAVCVNNGFSPCSGFATWRDRCDK